MQFKTLIGAAALLVPAWALEFTNFPFPTNLPAGQPFTLTWSGATSGPVTITLRQGNPGNLNTVAVLTSSGSGGSYTWTPSASQIPAVENTNFAFEISQGSTVNYSQQFSVTGGTASALPSSAAASASLSSVVSSISASASSRASAIISSASSAAANATMTRSSSASVTTSTSSRASSGTATATSAPASSGNNLKSPVALILGAFAAIVYLS